MSQDGLDEREDARDVLGTLEGGGEERAPDRGEEHQVAHHQVRDLRHRAARVAAVREHRVRVHVLEELERVRVQDGCAASTSMSMSTCAH